MNRRKVLLTFALVAFLVAIPALAAPVAAASQGSGSGPTTTVLDAPVQWTFTGLDASTAYELICTTGSNYTVVETATSDSNGKLTLTVDYFYDTGSNSYCLDLDATGMTHVQFNIDNFDIMPYIVLMITVTILMSILGMFGSRRGGLF